MSKDDNIETIRGGKRDASSLAASAAQGLAKAREDSFVAKMKPKLQKLEEMKRGVALLEAEIEQDKADYDAGR